ncbi:hypothetical protein [Jiulongibacter sp. NS-SX5]
MKCNFASKVLILIEIDTEFKVYHVRFIDKNGGFEDLCRVGV